VIRLLHVHFAGRTVLLLISETILVAAALIAAVFGWVAIDGDAPLVYGGELYKFLLPCAMCMLSMYYYDLYDSAVLRSTRECLPRLVQALGTVCVAIMLLYYVYPVVQLDRGAFLIWIALAGVVLVMWRHLFWVLNRSSRLSQRTLLIGTGPLAQALPYEIAVRPELGIDLLGFVGPEVESSETDLFKLGELEQLDDLVEERNISRLIITMRDRRGALPVEALLAIKSRGVTVQDGVQVYEAITGKIHLESLRPSWLLFSNGFCVSKAMLLYKRVASIIFSILGLVVSLPVMMIVALAIRLDSPGPILFRQKRVGRGGKQFTIFKFRTMFQGSDSHGAWKPAEKRDRRFTRLGKWLRRTRLDELPQLYNILRGDMYFIGPRPFTSNLENDFSQQIPFYSYRWRIKPGATGWAQTQRGYCSSLEDNAEKLSYDLYYVKNLSLGLDCLILFQTIKILLLGRGSR